jgi:hypothetical protein
MVSNELDFKLSIGINSSWTYSKQIYNTALFISLYTERFLVKYNRLSVSIVFYSKNEVNNFL